MAIVFMCGFESGSLGEWSSTLGTPSVQSTVKRSGSYALRCNPTGATASVGYVKSVTAPTFRVWIRIDSLPSVSAQVVNGLNLNSTGTVTIQPAGVNVTSSSSFSADSTWHCLESDYTGTETVVYVDGVEWARATTSSTTTTLLTLGPRTNTTCDIYFDDFMVCDSPLSSTTGYNRNGKQLLLLPTADPGALNSWTNGGGGTTSIFEGVNNIPPTGAAASTNGIKIKNAANGPLDYTPTMQTYTAAGVPSEATVNAVQAICSDGEEVTTASKAGAVWVASNPAQTAGTPSFNYGDDGAAVGTYPTGWATHYGDVSAAPSVTLGTAPTMTVRKTTATTRVVDVCLMGIYVDYTPPSASTIVLSTLVAPQIGHMANTVISV